MFTAVLSHHMQRGSAGVLLVIAVVSLAVHVFFLQPVDETDSSDTTATSEPEE